MTNYINNEYYGDELIDSILYNLKYVFLKQLYNNSLWEY